MCQVIRKFVLGAFYGIALLFFSLSYADEPLRLQAGGWIPEVKDTIDQLINAHQGQGKVVIVDFDNTLIQGDIEQATMEALKAKNVRIRSTTPQRRLYAALAEPRSDIVHASEIYWPVQDLSGLTINDLIVATKDAYESRHEQRQRFYRGESPEDMQPSLTFYPEMVDLLGNLLTGGYDLWVVSSSNVWSVRWMVTQQLNKLLAERFGEGVGIKQDHVMGITTLMYGPDDQLYKDSYLVHHNDDISSKYQQFEPEALKQFKLTNLLVFPLSSGNGKVASIIQRITQEQPFLVVGDSNTDIPMLRMAENRLWLAHLDRVDQQAKISSVIQGTTHGQWLVQAISNQRHLGFINSEQQLQRFFFDEPLALQTALKSLAFLRVAQNCPAVTSWSRGDALWTHASN